MLLNEGRWLYAAMVVEDGVRPAFGDWAAITDKYLGTLFACGTMPPEFRGQVYLLRVLRNWMGEMVAMDVYTQDYRPLFRRWLMHRCDESLFAVPHWGAFCDPAQTRDLVRNAAEGHVLELEVSQQPVEARRSIWLGIEPPPLHGFLVPSEL